MQTFASENSIATAGLIPAFSHLAVQDLAAGQTLRGEWTTANDVTKNVTAGMSTIRVLAGFSRFGGAIQQTFTELLSLPRGAAGRAVTAPITWDPIYGSAALADVLPWALQSQRLAAAEKLADSLETAAAGQSSMRKARRHDAYDGLTRLGDAAVSVALRRLRESKRPLWLFFLTDMVSERPAEGAANIDEAASEWREWGRRNSLLS